MRSWRNSFSYSNVVATIALFFALSGGVAIAAGGIPGDNGEIQGCYKGAAGDDDDDGGNGQLRVVRDKRECKKSESALSWNQEGPEGDRGPEGERGQEGEKGANGDDGPSGPTGPQGERGPQGETGPAGAVGEPGANGVDGAPGAQGPIGADGPAGPMGAVGPIGLPGPVGPAGAIGLIGPPGPAGPPGQSVSGQGSFAGTIKPPGQAGPGKMIVPGIGELEAHCGNRDGTPVRFENTSSVAVNLMSVGAAGGQQSVVVDPDQTVYAFRFLGRSGTVQVFSRGDSSEGATMWINEFSCNTVYVHGLLTDG